MFLYLVYVTKCKHYVFIYLLLLADINRLIDIYIIISYYLHTYYRVWKGSFLTY